MSLLRKKDAIDNLQTESLDVSGKERQYPGIEDYYHAASQDPNKSLTYQHGLSNFSNIVFGDDRIAFTKSMSQETFQVHEELAEKMKVVSEQKARMEGKTPAQRNRDYSEATEIVGEGNLDRMEEMMRDKLQQRTQAGPFQLRKTFKYFDRDNSGGIDIGEFSRALELMGFQFNEMQILALFGRYDSSAAGEVDYQDFVDKLIDQDFGGVKNSTTGKKLANVVDHIVNPENHDDTDEENAFDDDDSAFGEEDEKRSMKEAEVRRVFSMIDRDNTGAIERGEFELLLLALNLHLSADDIDKVMAELDVSKTGVLNFDDFYSWWDRAGL